MFRIGSNNSPISVVSITRHVGTEEILTCVERCGKNLRGPEVPSPFQ